MVKENTVLFQGVLSRVKTPQRGTWRGQGTPLAPSEEHAHFKRVGEEGGEELSQPNPLQMRSQA